MEKKTDFKALPTKSKFQYIWDYYRWHIIGTIIVVSVAASLIHHYVTYQDPALNIIMINSNHYEYTDMSPFDEFLAYAGIDAENTGGVSFVSTPYFGDNTSSAADTYTDYEVMGVQIATGSVDIFMGNGSIYESYAEEGALTDLTQILSAEVLERYAGHLLYSTAGDTADVYPCAIEFTNNDWLAAQDYYNGSCYAGVFANAPNPENAIKFLEFLIAND